MELSAIIPHIEALIFASEKPLTSLEIVELVNTAFGFMEERISPEQVETSIQGIREKYKVSFILLKCVKAVAAGSSLQKKNFIKHSRSSMAKSF